MIEIRPARYRDALELAPRLRVEDAAEIHATWGLRTAEGLCVCLLQSDRSFALVESGEVLGLWGVSGADVAGLKLGFPWLLAADGLFARRREIVGRSRDWVERLQLDYDVLTNLTLASNATHLRWLAWCGFRVLRVHRRYGSAGLPYCEFYRVNPLRHVDDRGVRETLLGRRLRPQPEVDPLLRAAARFAAAGFPAAALRPLLDDVQARHLAEGRMRPALAALLIEAATLAWRRQCLEDPGLLEWAGNMLAMVETARLDGLSPAELVFTLDTGRPCAGPGRGHIAPANPPLRGLAGLAGLVRHFVATLTLGDRVGRIQGRRLRLAAIGIGEDASRRPLGIACDQLAAVWSRHRPFTAGHGARTAASMSAGELLERVRGGAGAVEGLIGEVLEGWVGDAAADASRCGGRRTSAAAAAMQLADRAARALLPAPRSGGVLAGFADRQYLHCLLRCRLLAVAGDDGGGMAADIGALLVAERAERRLLTLPEPPAPEDDLAAVLESITAVFGTAAVGRGGDLERLLAVLAPAFAVASLPGARLAPVLLAWHLLLDGRLDDVLQQILELRRGDQADWRADYRRLLHGLTRTVDAVSVQRLLIRGGECGREAAR